MFASDSWGLISAHWGIVKTANKTFIDKCWFGNNPNTLKNILYTRNVTIHDWKKACRRFEEALTEVNNEKQKVIKLQQQVNRLQEVRENIKKKEKQLALLLRDERLSLEKYKEKEQELDHCRAENHSRSMWKKVLSFLRSLRAKTRIKKELKGLKESISYIKQSIEKETKEKKELCEEKKELEQTIQASKITVIDQDFWNKTYHEIQNSSPWVTKSLTQARVNLFLEAMHVHEVFIQYTKSKLRGCLDGFVNLNSGELKNHPDVIQPIWDALFLVVPVISTTFASIGNMFKGLEKESLGWLFIDEAGQAIPQAAVGAIWRAKHTIVVGDPFQIQPVVTIPNSIIADIAQRYHVSSDDVSVSSSVQTIADRANYYGKKMRNEDGNWIGVPLWVHRRCINPMFTISNCISYDGNMVLATAKPNHSFDYIGDSCWFDVKGKAQPKHYVPEQGQVVMQLLKKCWIYQIKQHELRKSSGFRFPKVYVISPFKSVVKELKKNIRLEFNALGKQSGVKAHEFHQWINESIGTVHTFQGKETDIVIFCLGVDQSHVKAAQWAVKTANLLNVAVSRAKYRFYIVGDYALWGQMNYMNEAARELDYIKVHHTSQLVR